MLCPRLALLAALGGLALIAHAQAPAPPPPPPPPPPPAAARTRLAFVTNNPSDYWTICRKGAEAAARDLNRKGAGANDLSRVDLQFILPDDGTAATQERDVNDLLRQGVDGIAVSPVDPANETQYLNGVAAKTNLITADSDAAASRRLCYVGTDNRAAGVMAGELLKKALPSGGQVMLFVGKADAQNARDRIAGIRDALHGSRITILGVRTDDADHLRAKQNVVDTLAEYPRIAGLVGLWSYNGPAIAGAVRAKGRAGKVRVVAFDEADQTLDAVRDGVIYGTVAQQPYRFGYVSVKMLAALAGGDKSVLPAGRRMIVPTLAITRGTLAAYRATHLKQLAAP